MLAIGSMVCTAAAAAKRLQEAGISAEVVNASTVKPLDIEYLESLTERKLPVFTLEEHVLDGGFGSSILEYNALHGGKMTVHPIAVKDEFIPHGDHRSLIKATGLDEETVAKTIQQTLSKSGGGNE